MLVKSRRLTSQKDFDRVFKKGRKVKENFLVLAVSENNLDETRFGFVVSQKVSKKAVVRNKIKRRLRALVGSRIKQIKKGLDAVFIAAPGLESESFQETEKTIERLFEKAKCQKD